MSIRPLIADEQLCERWPVIPDFKPGVTLYAMSILLYKISAGRNVENTFFDMYGKRKANVEPGDPLGRYADAAAKIFFENRKTRDEVIRQHTVSGIFDLLLSPEWRNLSNNVLRGHVTGRNPVDVYYIKDAIKPMAWCPICAEMDLDEDGWAGWHSAHQVPFIHHCHIHRVPLLNQCKNCNQPVDTGAYWRLPGRACHKCGQQEYIGFVVEESEGYMSLLDNLSRIIRLAADSPSDAIGWNLISNSLKGDWIRENAVILDTNGQLCRKWDVNSVTDIPKILGVHGWGGKHPELIWHEYDNNPLRALLLFDIISDIC